MKIEEAIKQIDCLAEFIMKNIEGEPSKSEGAIECAIRLLEKQIPKKPRIINGGTNTCHDTDCCNDVFRWYSYCPVCGQAIDWSKEQ